jgi:6-phosphogluconolactonase/glucosamine-6-phosphate isomerase/deaminase
MTTTISFLKDKIMSAVAVIAGADKKVALDKVMAEEGNISETPGRVMKEMKNVLLLTDIL